MKLTEVKQFRETTYRKKIKEAFPNASEQIINEAVSAAMNEIDIAKGLQTGLKTAKNLGGAAVKAGKKAVKTATPLVKQGLKTAVKTGKDVAQKTGKVVKKVTKDIGKGYDNVKNVAKKGIKVAGQALDQAGDELSKNATAQAGRSAKVLNPDTQAGVFTKGVSNIKGGKNVTGQQSRQLAPHIANLEKVLANPQLRQRWKQLVQAANR